MMHSITLTITHTAPLGDGMGHHEGLPVYVPYAMEGDIVRVEIVQNNASLIRARIIELITPSPDRQSPLCPYFGTCGGCSLQHLSSHAYRRFKEQMAQRILHQLHQPLHLLQPLTQVGAGSRRRVQWAVQVHKGVVRLGYQQAKSHEMVAIEACPVALPALSDLLVPLNACLQSMKKPSYIASVALTAAENGYDMMLHLRNPLHATDRALLAEFAQQHRILRIATDAPALLHQSAEPRVRFGEIEVALPIGAFLQASAQAQDAIISLIRTHLHGCTHLVDIYAGCGTYSLPLLSDAQHIFAYEGASEMIAALHNAAHHAGYADKLTASRRDLFTHPLRASEVRHAEGVIINPPRNGALPQIKELTLARIPKVAMVSCNPATFIRDAAHLLASGYILESLTPVDQFVWSSHLEVVGLFYHHYGAGS